MCLALTTPLLCVLQMLVRILMTFLVMLESLIRMILQTIYNILAFFFQVCAVIPICLIFMLSSNVRCMAACGGGSCFNGGRRSPLCNCFMTLLCILLFLLLLDHCGLLGKFLGKMGLMRNCSKINQPKNKTSEDLLRQQFLDNLAEEEYLTVQFVSTSARPWGDINKDFINVENIKLPPVIQGQPGFEMAVEPQNITFIKNNIIKMFGLNNKRKDLSVESKLQTEYTVGAVPSEYNASKVYLAYLHKDVAMLNTVQLPTVDPFLNGHWEILLQSSIATNQRDQTHAILGKFLGKRNIVPPVKYHVVASTQKTEGIRSELLIRPYSLWPMYASQYYKKPKSPFTEAPKEVKQHLFGGYSHFTQGVMMSKITEASRVLSKSTRSEGVRSSMESPKSEVEVETTTTTDEEVMSTIDVASIEDSFLIKFDTSTRQTTELPEQDTTSL